MKKLLISLSILVSMSSLQANDYLDLLSNNYSKCFSSETKKTKLKENTFDNINEYIYTSNTIKPENCKDANNILKKDINDYIIYHYTNNSYKKTEIEKHIEQIGDYEKNLFYKEPIDNYRKLSDEDVKFFAFIVENVIEYKARKEFYYQSNYKYDLPEEIVNFNKCLDKNKNIITFSLQTKTKINDILNNNYKLIVNKSCNESYIQLERYFSMYKAKIINNLVNTDLAEEFITKKFKNLNMFIVIAQFLKI